MIVIQSFQKPDWATRNKEMCSSPERYFREMNKTGNNTQRFMSPPPSRSPKSREPVFYPGFGPRSGYYNSYHTGGYGDHYRRPYEDNYRELYEHRSRYPYRPVYEDISPPRRPREDRYTPRARYPHDEEAYYRRESFSEYRDHNAKKSRPSRSCYASPPRYKTNRSHRPIHEISDNELSDHSPPDSDDSDNETARSIIDITEKTKKITTKSSHDYSDDDIDSRKVPAQEREGYEKRLELLYAILDDHLVMPEVEEETSGSLARGKIVAKPKPESLPPAGWLERKFLKHYKRAKKAIATEAVKSEQRTSEPAKEVRVADKSAPTLGFEANPFHPKWLYKVHDQSWPTRVKPDDDIPLLTHAPITENFVLSLNDLQNIQYSSTLAMNAASHIEYLLMATQKLITEAKKPDADMDVLLPAISDLVGGAAYANEYVTDQQIYIHAGVTHTMRMHHIAKMQKLTAGEIRDLLITLYDAGALFNGKIPQIAQNIRDRNTGQAMENMANHDPPPPPKPLPDPAQDQTKPNLKALLRQSYGTKSSASKAAKKNNYGSFDSKGKKKPKQSSSWPKSSNKGSSSHSFPGKNSGFNKKGGFPKKGSKSKSGGRNRDYHN